MSDVEPIDDEAELALARLEWARAAGCCLDLPSQREALEWHVACWETALSASDDSTAANGSQ